MPRRIIIDTDPGIDDAVAILLALAAPEELEVEGIVAVAGNLPLALTERNARRMCELAGRQDISVYAGCARPLLRPLATAAGVTLPISKPAPPMMTSSPIPAAMSGALTSAMAMSVSGPRAARVTLPGSAVRKVSMMKSTPCCACKSIAGSGRPSFSPNESP
jgi:hypothetical protein